MATSTFSLAAHSLTSSVEAVFAPGTQWSHNMSDSLPAAWAVRTNGAASVAADAAAVLPTNCRRVSFVFRISIPLLSQNPRRDAPVGLAGGGGVRFFPRLARIACLASRKRRPAGRALPIGLGKRRLPEIPSEALMREFQMLAHGRPRAFRLVRGDGIADGRVLLVRGAPRRVVLQVPCELREVRVDALVEEFPDRTQQDHIAEDLRHGPVEAAIECNPPLDVERSTGID